MENEVLFYTDDTEGAKSGVVEAGGRVSHILTDHLVAALLPEGVGLSSVPGAAPVDLEQLQGTERRVAEAWVSRLGWESVPSERFAQAASGPSVVWDAAGLLPPDGPGDEHDSAVAPEDPPFEARAPLVDTDVVSEAPVVVRSTGTPTSLTLTGAVSVGVVMVSGPQEAWLFSAGALKHVSVGSDGTVWGVNGSYEIHRRDGGGWVRIPGALKQISVGSASRVWGVNANNNIYRLS